MSILMWAPILECKSESTLSQTHTGARQSRQRLTDILDPALNVADPPAPSGLNPIRLILQRSMSSRRATPLRTGEFPFYAWQHPLKMPMPPFMWTRPLQPGSETIGQHHFMSTMENRGSATTTHRRSTRLVRSPCARSTSLHGFSAIWVVVACLLAHLNGRRARPLRCSSSTSKAPSTRFSHD